MNLTKINQEQIVRENTSIREFHLPDLPDTLFILFKTEVNDLFFKKMYSIFGTQKEFSKFLGRYRQDVNKYHRQIDRDKGRYYPVYFSLKLFKKCIPLLDKSFINYLEQNISEIRARVGLSIYNPKLPIKESEEIYRITAHVIADGSAGKEKTPYYANTCKVLRDQFKQDLSILGKMKISETIPNTTEIVYFPKVVTDVLAHIFDVKFTYPNRIPKSIFNTKRKFKQVFLQALFDDEGTISTHLAVGIHNLNIMNEIKSLINSLGIETSKIMIHLIPNKTDKIYLQIPTSEYLLFQQEIGFAHPDKIQKLELAIRTRNRKQRTRNPDIIEHQILKILDEKPSPTIDLANGLLFTITGIKPHLHRMHKEGIIVRKGYKNKIIWDIT